MTGDRTDPNLVREMFDLRAEGLSFRLIAERVGISKTTVGEILRDTGQPFYMRTCWCGEQFTSQRADAIYCSHAHGAKHWRIFGASRAA